MTASMTGFARGESSGPWGTLTCEVRSVNHRFLDISLRLPDACRSLESELRQMATQRLRRGKVDCTFTHRVVGASAAALEVDQAALDQLLVRLRHVSDALPSGLRTELSPIDVLRFPGILREEAIDAEALQAAVRKLFASTVEQLAEARLREGARLAALLETRCEALAQGVQALRARLPELHQRVKQRFADRLKELEPQLAVDPARLESEIALQLQKGDVAEELDRLAGHIVETRTTLAGEEPAGRRLDFLMQEFNREANTLSSKSMDLETTRIAVEMKVVIEQMREQVQNIE